MKIRYVLLLIVSTTVLAACATKIDEPKPEDTMVFDYFDRSSGFPGLVIRVNSGETELEISKPGSKACANRANGCLNIRRGKQANIGFKLDTAGWHFSEFSLCIGEDKPLAGTTCELKLRHMRDFDIRPTINSKKFKSPNPEGIIDLTKLTPGLTTLDLTSFVLHIENNIRQYYFYNVEACKNGVPALDPPICLKLDPVVRNKGR